MTDSKNSFKRCSCSPNSIPLGKYMVSVQWLLILLIYFSCVWFCFFGFWGFLFVVAAKTCCSCSPQNLLALHAFMCQASIGERSHLITN